MESVSKMPGHKNLKTTQLYSEGLDSKISGEMGAPGDKMKFGEKKHLKVI